MGAKPTKCRSRAVKKSEFLKTSRRTSTANTPYDPQLEIGGIEIPFIHQSSMRFLGLEIFKDLSDKEIISGVDSKLKDLLVRVDKDNVNSLAKLWMYKNHIVSRMSWESIIY